MIPHNIDRQSVLDAIRYIDENGIPKTRISRTYNLKYNGNLYPPKYLISIANKIANGHELRPFEFGGGVETNSFLEKLGFDIISNQIDETLSSKNDSDQIEVVTVVIGHQSEDRSDNGACLIFMKQAVKEFISADIILFPAGYFYFDHQRSNQINQLCNQMSDFLKTLSFRGTVCVGVDCDEGRDQLAVAVNRDGIQAIGRKFYPTGDERGYIREAKTYNALEMGYSRIFKVKNKSVFLAVCYDSFGIRHCDLPNPGIDIVLVLAHQFWKQGEGLSGDVDFARKGFAGASQHWKCVVFGTAVFFCRDIPLNWPTGILWTDQSKSVKNFKYKDNRLVWKDKKELTSKYEEALCYRYILGGD